MIGADTTFLVQLELVEVPAHQVQRHQLGRKRILDTQLAATLWSAGIQRLVTSNPVDFRLLGFEALVPQP